MLARLTRSREEFCHGFVKSRSQERSEAVMEWWSGGVMGCRDRGAPQRSEWMSRCPERASASWTDGAVDYYAEKSSRRAEIFLGASHFLRSRSVQSQRDCVFQPRVATTRLPWENVGSESQPQRGCGRRYGRTRRKRNRHNRVAVDDLLADDPR